MNITEEDIVIDVFEGSGLLDLEALHKSKIRKVLVRLGCYNMFGINGNRKDKLFDRQWSLLASDPYFEKGVYLPYNPWRTWQYNLQWALDNIPSDCSFVEWDIENKWLPYSGKSYAANVIECLKRMPESFSMVIYTGEGYLHLLEWKEKGVTVSGWPKNMDYSWAQYPYTFYPKGGETWTWEKFLSKLFGYSGPYNKFRCPGRLILHQITGDKIVLPGSDKGLDVYVSQISSEELDGKFVSDGVILDPPSVEITPAIPGPFSLPSDADLTGNQTASFDERFPGAKLDAYPATVVMEETWIDDGVVKKGRGNLSYSDSWMTAHTRKLTEKQYDWFWRNETGVHNGPHGEFGRVQQVTCADSVLKRNRVWVEREDNDYYYIQCYYNDQPAPDLSTLDPYRMHFLTVMHRTLNANTGGIFYPNVGKVPYPLLAEKTGHTLRIEKKHCKSMVDVPFQTTTKTPNSRLMVRSTPGATDPETILTRLDNSTPITVFAFEKVGNAIWGRITSPDSLPGWIHMGFTNWKV